MRTTERQPADCAQRAGIGPSVAGTREGVAQRLGGLSYGEQIQMLRPPLPLGVGTGSTTGPLQPALPIQFSGGPAQTPAVQRATVTPKPGNAKDAAGLKAMTLSAFVAHAKKQADWNTQIPDTDKDKVPLQNVLAWATKNESVPVGCGAFKVADLAAATEAVLGQLAAYSAGVHQPEKVPTGKLPKAANIAKAKEFGEALQKLEQTPGGTCIFAISEPAALAKLIELKFVDDFIAYVKACNPVLHAKEGVELESYQTLRLFADPKGYKSRLPRVRNYHRFEFMALEKLVANVGDTSKTKAVTLILHSAVDHNGAFHHDPKLTAVVLNPNWLTLMVEGVESLKAIEAEIPVIAKTYGLKDKLDQVMIAGHGDARMIQLGGKVKEGKDSQTGDPKMVEDKKNKDENLDLDKNKEDTEAFLETLLKHIETREPTVWEKIFGGGPSKRIVFNACLTGSINVKSNKVKNEAQLKKYIAKHGSLTHYLRDMANTNGLSIDVRGANGSFGKIGLQDPDGKLNLLSAKDPKMTAKKLVYIKEGTDPGGVLRAIVEEWKAPTTSVPQPDWMVAVRNRARTVPPASWKAAIIDGVCAIALEPATAKDLAKLNKLRKFGELLYHVGTGAAKAGILNFANGPISAADQAKVYGTLATTQAWKNDIGPDVTVLQVWMKTDTSKKGALISTLDAYSVSTARGNIDFKHIGKDLKDLVPLGSAGSATQGMMVLAALDALTVNSKHAGKFLKAAYAANGNSFTGTELENAIQGSHTVDQVLKAIGLNKKAGKKTSVDANIDTDADKRTNEGYVDPVNRYGQIVSAQATVRDKPSSKGAKLGSVKKGERKFFFGENGAWLAFDSSGRSGFVKKSAVKLT